MEPSKKPNPGLNSEGTVFKDHAEKEARPGQSLEASRQNEKLEHARTFIGEGPAGNGLCTGRSRLRTPLPAPQGKPASRRRR